MTIVKISNVVKGSSEYTKGNTRVYEVGHRILKEKKSCKHSIAGSTIIDFDILEKDETRIGVMQIIISDNVDEIHDTGNLGGFLLEGREDPELIYSSALHLENILIEEGVHRIRCVAPINNIAQVDAMKLLETEKTEEFLDDNCTYVAYEKSV
ncbi:MAG: hypothetical protein HRU20_17960 [Pseudomonadales bacterium]|nr:hypothetical protein [Pseudomonadales bacterium]